MENWWSNFIEGLKELPISVWAILALTAAVGIVFLILLKKKANKKALIIFAVLSVAAFCILLLFTIPELVPDFEGGGVTTIFDFIYSPVFWAVVLVVIGIIVLTLLSKKTKWTASMLASGALCVSIGFILSCLVVYRMPWGGSITPGSMLPLLLFSWVYGPVPGILAGVVTGVFQLIQDAYVIHPVQLLLDYILPFAMLGLAGIIKDKNRFPLAIVLGASLRFVMHFLSGVVFFASYAWEGFHPAVYSLLYNAAYLVPETLIVIGISLIPKVKNYIIRLKTQSFT